MKMMQQGVINDYIYERTVGKINDTIEADDLAETKLLLILFKGKWKVCIFLMNFLSVQVSNLHSINPNLYFHFAVSEINSNIDVKSELQQSGVTDIFNSIEANLSKMFMIATAPAKHHLMYLECFIRHTFGAMKLVRLLPL